MGVGSVSSTPVKVMPAPAPAAGTRLLLEGVDMGAVQSVRGGVVSANVIQESPAGSILTAKHVGVPSYGDIKFTFGFGVDTAIFSWIEESWKQNYSRRDGSVVVTDQDGAMKSQIAYTSGIITEVGFPSMDTQGKDQGYLKVTVSPEYTRSKPPDKNFKAYQQPRPRRRYLTSNFKLSIDNLDCSQVVKIDDLVVKSPGLPKLDPGTRDFQQAPPRMNFPDLVVTFGKDPGKTWHDWFTDFVIRAKGDSDQERNGSIELLSEDRSSTICKLTLKNLGIFSFSAPPFSVGGDDIVARIYCEQMLISA